MLVILAIQVLVLNYVHLLNYATPLIIGYMLTCFRRGSSRTGILFWGFATGLIFDIFSNTLGMGAISCTMLAMLQPSILRLFTPRDAADDFSPKMRNLGLWKFLSYTFINFLILHAIFYALDAFTISNWELTLTAVFGGTLLSSATALIIETAIVGKDKK